MSQWFELFTIVALIQACFAPPITKTKEEQSADATDVLQDYMEYHRYLRQVVNALESDAEFRKKLETTAEEDIKSGKIALELEFVDHNIRTRLDELKRTELQRLKDLIRQKEMMGNAIDDGHHHHLDASNPHTFEIEDLKNLILKTTADLHEADRKRRDEFKRYELQKEYEKRYKLNNTEGDARIKLEKEYQTNEEQHKNHVKLHEPGHKAQLEEVWEQQDHMQQDFDPKAFFMLHDLDNNRLWDEDEVKALFIKELDKMYKAGRPEDDMRERIEEMERMRETVFVEMDVNRDGFIDFSEFLSQTKRQEYQRDNGWQGIDERKQYTNDELEEYISRHHAMENGYPAGVYPHRGNQQPYYDPQMGHPGQMGHPNEIPQQQEHFQQPQQQYAPPQQVPAQYQQRGNVANVPPPPNLNTNEIYANQQENHQNALYLQQQNNKQLLNEQQAARGMFVDAQQPVVSQQQFNSVNQQEQQKQQRQKVPAAENAPVVAKV